MSESGKYSPAPNLTGMSPDSLSRWVTGELGEKAFRARQIFSWIHSRGAESFHGMTDIPLTLRNTLSRCARLTVLETLETLRSRDGTRRFLLALDDGLAVESVLIPDLPRNTACLSTQVGCRMGCALCMTGRAGFRRNLLSHEIAGQFYALRKASGERISNLVLMGMGEPLDNLDQVLTALEIITHGSGPGLGQRKVTISTIGLPGGIPGLASMGRQYGLALSLHSAVQSTRDRLIPAGKSMGLSGLKRDLITWSSTVGRRVTLEYCLIAGINDSPAEAEALADFARGLPCKINLLLHNPVPGLDWKRPDEETVSAFMSYLYPRCPAVTLRKSRGGDIRGACGQLGASLLERESGG